jgi:mannitol operon repressor
MDPNHLQDFSRFLGELQAETDRGLPLVAAALIDEKLLETPQAFLCMGKAPDRLLVDANAPLAALSARVDACFALGLIDEFEYQETSVVRKSRNEFAHARHGLTFADQRIESLCATLKTELPTGIHLGSNPARTRFTYASIGLVSRLYYRAAWVANERRTPRTWTSPEQVRWRSVAEELPTEGVPVLTVRSRKNGETPT